MSTKRIFKVRMVNYLLRNGYPPLKVSQHENGQDLIFHFEKSKRLKELMDNYPH
ncbi:DUF5659 domain-containing protein [Bacillus anthracis]|uniref:DUF5659 domain-containing protein n=1 Tax=Bacillus anthracis TaxID=1392 RepID=UPI00207A7F3F|nr:DUF5659 domain-containing protein [Bacillus anthracis]USL02189.1 DUF5659 domain-containing protein [Bacillus anthracis]